MFTRYFIAYDIADPRRLRRVHDIVSAVGSMVQFSVYEAVLTLRERVLLEALLLPIMNQDEDQVLFLDFGLAARDNVPEVQALGRRYSPQRRHAVIV